MRRQIRRRTIAIAAKPQIHSAARTGGSQSVFGKGGAAVKGMAIRSTAIETSVETMADGRGMRLPREIKSAKGTRNLSDAQSHRQKRMCARLLRKASVKLRSPQTKWTAKDERSFRIPLSLLVKLTNGLLQFADIVQSEFARLRKLGHHGLRLAAEEAENLIE